MFLKFDMGREHLSLSDMRHDHFLNSTGDMRINKRQRHATLAFLKIDRRHGHPQSKFVFMLIATSGWPLTLKIDRATLPFFILDMRHGDLVTG